MNYTHDTDADMAAFAPQAGHAASEFLADDDGRTDGPGALIWGALCAGVALLGAGGYVAWLHLA